MFCFWGLTLGLFSLNLVLAINTKWFPLIFIVSRVTTEYNNQSIGGLRLWGGEYVETLHFVFVAMTRRWSGYNCNLNWSETHEKSNNKF